jgi:excisionase family DNA binding protein
MKDTDADTDWLTTREAARRLAVPPRRLYDLIDQGALDAFRVEGDLKLRSADVARYHADLPPPSS